MRALIDGLRREFPQIFAFAHRIPAPRLARASLPWGVLAAFGAEFVVSAVATIVLSLLFRSPTQAPFPAPFEIARLLSTAAALAVAWTVGGRTGVAGYVGIVVLERLLGLPSQLRFCGTGSDPSLTAAFCSVGAYVVALWPQVLGAALAFALVRWLRTGAGDRNSILEAAGTMVLVQAIGGSLLNASLGPARTGSAQWPLLILLLAIAAGIAMGYTILRRATRQWPTLGIVALVLAAEFAIVSVPTFLSQVSQTRGTNLIGPFDLLAYFSPIFVLGAAALVLYIAAARKVTTTEVA